MPELHEVLLVEHESDGLDRLVRNRIRALRVAQGWSLEELATRTRMSQSSLSRIENGQRRLALDQLVTLARALDTSLDQLVETDTDDVVSNPMIEGAHGQRRWAIRAEPGMTVVRRRITDPPPDNPARLRAHTGREWLVVLSGTAILLLGDRRFRVETADRRAAAHLPHRGADWGITLTAAGYTLAAERTIAVDEAHPRSAAVARYAHLVLGGLRDALADELPAADLAALDELLATDGPNGVLHRDDLVVRTERTAWAAHP